MFARLSVLLLIVLIAQISLSSAPYDGPNPLVISNDALRQVLSERAIWESNRLGVTGQVPPPWTPITVSNMTASCWGRTYDFERSLFPRQITSQGQTMLSGPIVLTVEQYGKRVELGRSEIQQLRSEPNELDLEASAFLPGLIVKTRSHMEYDGCVKIELGITATSDPVVISGLELRIPMRTDRALYYHWFEASRDPRLTNSGSLPREGLKSHFKPQLWLGDNDRGLCWFAESPKGWPITPDSAVLTVERGDGANVMSIRMSDRPLEVATTWSTVFGLMATPARPMPDGWRDWLAPLNQSNPWEAWAPGFNNLGRTPDPGTLTPRDSEGMRLWVEQSHAYGHDLPLLPIREPMRVIPYSQVVFWSRAQRDGTASPEVAVFGDEWSNQRKSSPHPAMDPTSDYHWVCPSSSFSQFYIYRLAKLIDDIGIDGIYIDGSWNTCANASHGCGYQDSHGKWQPEYKIWAFRDLLKRIYCLFYEKHRNPIIQLHTSSWLCMPSLSFSHMMIDGEQYHDEGQRVENHYLDVVPMDKWRAEHTGRQWGPAPFLIPEIPGPWVDSDAPTRELLMLANLHDTALFPGAARTKLIVRNYQARRFFGVAESEFRGYWDEAAWARCETPECAVSGYRHLDGGRTLLVVANTSGNSSTVLVRPDLAKLRPRSRVNSAVDIQTGEEIPLRNGILSLPVEGRDFRLVALPYYKPPVLTAGDLRATARTGISNPGFEKGMAGWKIEPLEDNGGTVTLDRNTAYNGSVSCQIFKANGPGGMMIQTEEVYSVRPGNRYRVNCRLKVGESAGSKAYWMISQLDAEGNVLGENNLFHGFICENQDWKPLPFEFEPLAEAVAVRLHFIVAFPGSARAWVDNFSFETLP